MKTEGRAREAVSRGAWGIGSLHSRGGLHNWLFPCFRCAALGRMIAVARASSVFGRCWITGLAVFYEAERQGEEKAFSAERIEQGGGVFLFRAW